MLHHICFEKIINSIHNNSIKTDSDILFGLSFVFKAPQFYPDQPI